MPAWLQLPLDSKSDSEAAATEIVESCNRIRARFSLPDVRRAICAYHEYSIVQGGLEKAEAFSRIFVLNRALFAVPEWVDRSGLQAWGGFVGVPVVDGRVGLLWPLARTHSGGLVLAHPWRGYMGADYAGVAEFDYFARRFGPRASD